MPDLYFYIMRQSLFKVSIKGSDVNMDKRTNESQEGSIVERSKPRYINPVVRTLEGSTVECSK